MFGAVVWYRTKTFRASTGRADHLHYGGMLVLVEGFEPITGTLLKRTPLPLGYTSMLSW